MAEGSNRSLWSQLSPPIRIAMPIVLAAILLSVVSVILSIAGGNAGQVIFQGVFAVLIAAFAVMRIISMRRAQRR